jgi:hypothetical protein
MVSILIAPGQKFPERSTLEFPRFGLLACPSCASLSLETTNVRADPSEIGKPSVGTHSRSLEIDFQGGIEKELEGLILFLTYGVYVKGVLAASELALIQMTVDIQRLDWWSSTNLKAG